MNIIVVAAEDLISRRQERPLRDVGILSTSLKDCDGSLNQSIKNVTKTRQLMMMRSRVISPSRLGGKPWC